MKTLVRKVLIGGIDPHHARRAVFLSLLVATLSLSGCFGEEEVMAVVEPEVKNSLESL